MSDTGTSQMMEMYVEESDAPMFLTSFFQTRPQNFHNKQKVEMDIIRDEEDIAIPVTDLSAGGRKNESSLYDNKAFTPPVLKEEGTVTAYKQMERRPGRDPFQDIGFVQQVAEEAFVLIRKVDRKIRRTVELMSAQVLQGDAISLVNAAGTVLYALDFLGKATHKITVGTTWAADGSTGDPIGDVTAAALVVRRDGKKQPRRLVFGATAFARWLANTNVRARIVPGPLGLGVGALQPTIKGEGATFQGLVWIGHYQFEMWTYDGFYKHPQTAALTPYVGDENVIIVSDNTRLDMTYGAIPRLVPPEARAMQFLPSRISSSTIGMDLSLNAWLTPDGEALVVSAGTRPLPIPTAIDTTAYLDITH